MQPKLKVAITGDTILTRRVSVVKEERFLSLIDVIRDADVAYTHFEGLIHDYDGPEVYPAAEAGFTWMRMPRFAADELKWIGFNLMSHASNHCMDYSYGGLFSTLNALDEAGLAHAGTGRTLGEARQPVYLETEQGRVALISMCSSLTGWARAGDTRSDLKGRPGLNPLRFHYEVDKGTLENLQQLAVQMGWWITNEHEGLWLFNPAGIHNTTYAFVEGSRPGMHTVANEDDVQGNLRSIKDAKRQADLVLVHLHSHEWDTSKGLQSPAEFAVDFARASVDAGADAFICEGSHSPIRGIEIYKKRPIFYDPGDFIGMNNTVTKLPADFYTRVKYGLQVPIPEATPADAFDSRMYAPRPLNPVGGYFSAKVPGCVIPMCTFEGGELVELRLHPFMMEHQPRTRSGLPLRAEGDMARRIVEYLDELSSTFGTKVEFADGVGVVRL